MNNAEKFQEVFGYYATEMWAKPEKEFLKWINTDYEPKGEAINIVLCHKCINGVQVVGRKEEYVCMMRGELVEKNGYCHKGVLRGEE